MMCGLWAVYYRELLLMRQRWFRMLVAMAVAPLLYLVTFGLGLGQGVRVEGAAYALFLLPGLMALSSMQQAFSLAGEINIARFYFKIFEVFQASPLPPAAWVLAEVWAGMTRALLAALLVAALALAFGYPVPPDPLLGLAVLLNGFFFASLAVAMAMLVRSHQDQGLLVSFLITPMAFLGGTFFSPAGLPPWANTLLDLLPLTHAARTIRQAWLGQQVELWRLGVLATLGLAAFLLATWLTRKAND